MILRKGERRRLGWYRQLARLRQRQAHHIAGDHQLFIGIDHRHFDHRIFGLNKGGVVLVFLFIDREPEEIQVMADGAPARAEFSPMPPVKISASKAAHLHNIAADSGANALGKQRERQAA